MFKSTPQSKGGEAVEKHESRVNKFDGAADQKPTGPAMKTGQWFVKTLAIFAVLLAFSSLSFTVNQNEFGGFHHGKTAAAAVLDPKDYITGVHLYDTTHPEATHFGYYDALEADWDFAVPDDAELKAGDTLTIHIPEQLEALTDDDFNVLSTKGNVFAGVHVNKNQKTITVTFNKYAEEAVKDHTVHGELKLGLTFGPNGIKYHQSNHINWGFGSNATDVVVDPGNTPPANKLIFKWSWFDPDDKNLIHWQIRVDAADKVIDNAVVTDNFGPNQEMVPGSVNGGKTVYNAENNTFSAGTPVPQSDIHEGPGNNFSVNLNTIDQSYLFNVESRITDGRQQKSYANTAKVDSQNVPESDITVYQALTQGSGTADDGNKKHHDQPVPPQPNPEPKPEPKPTPNPQPKPQPKPEPKPTPVNPVKPRPNPRPMPRHGLPEVKPHNDGKPSHTGQNIQVGQGPMPETAKKAGWKLDGTLVFATVASMTLAIYFSKKNR
ncbi:hypothetical protein G6R29_05165 [Fructobacillus sp. M2-14]|uniref:Uncharacterized protein n=1 Tax=Fructobacillus broussonetiae TaxID=2713173 RepID=A0ABS5R0P5_9LACO|nr:collagen binding domain-containing protein [Fructobacillus broussonetiae]MBS9339009.1 hypothetical protein [Fructobacillus broussonetiae]